MGSEDPVTCYLEHFQEPVWVHVLTLVAVIVLTTLLIYLCVRRSRTKMMMQFSFMMFILMNLVMMTCETFGPLVIYLSGMFIAAVFVMSADISMRRYLGRRSIPYTIRSPGLRRRVRVHIVPSSGIFSFTFRRRIYLSSALLRVLSPGERDAVLIHELHHARRSVPPALLTMLALLSLTFSPARDEEDAHDIVRATVGERYLTSAMRKVGRPLP